MRKLLTPSRDTTPQVVVGLDPLPEPGTHVVTSRPGYTHHGIYVGNGMVVQYAGLARGLRAGCVEEITLEEFADGRPLWIGVSGPVRFDAHEIVRRARSRVGEDRYDLFTNNCEHFCEWCLHGRQHSYQVDKWLRHPHGVRRMAARILIAKVFAPLLLLLSRSPLKSPAGSARVYCNEFARQRGYEREPVRVSLRR